MPSLTDRIQTLVHRAIDSYPGAWMVWCDPAGTCWAPLLEAAAGQPAPFGFELVKIERRVFGHVGGLVDREAVAARLGARTSFVLLVPAAADDLGWLWAQALQAETIYSSSLREQLMAWGWRPTSLTMNDADILHVAMQHKDEDPAEWGGTGIQPDTSLLLEALAGAVTPDMSPVLALTIEQAGLPPFDASRADDWRTLCLARLLVTEAHTLTPALIPPAHELLIPEGQRGAALHLLDRWLDSVRLRRSLPAAVIAADRAAGFAHPPAPVPPVHGPFLSRGLELAALRALCADLAPLVGRDLLQALADAEPILGRHARGFWGAASLPEAVPWVELLRLSAAARAVLGAEPTAGWDTVQRALNWYIETGWELDRAGEEILRPVQPNLPVMDPVVAGLREAYRARWEATLIDWSNLWSTTGCPPLPLQSAGAWLAGELADRQAAAIVVVDALRYDAAMALATRVNEDEGTHRADVVPAAAPLPSVTALGMGLALPMPAEILRAHFDGTRWHLSEGADGLDLSVAENRRTWWKQHRQLSNDAFTSVGEILTTGAPEPTAARRLLVITDDLIDKLGHDDQLDLLGTGLSVDRYRQAIGRLREAGWRRVLFVTDHGFIHWTGAADQSRPAPQTGAAYKSRRALAWPADTHVDAAHTLAPGGAWRVVPAPGASSWSAYGGLGYFHGGASLQEWVIPCLRVAWPAEAHPVEVEIEPVPNILSERPAVTLRVERGSLFVEEALPRRVEVVIRHKTAHTILFRSPATDLRPDQTSVRVTLEVVPGSEANRGTPLRIEVREAASEQVIARVESTLMIEISEW